MLLVLDVGNTNTTLGVFLGERLTARSRLPTKRVASPEEYGKALLAALGAAAIQRE
ncbi:MAG: type III pantothenate kinase, partial [Oscillospiraceae bacterium]|nr:type III pantothenate kinase [Oscillospiraceae bacterium]